jgi:hypothetical protein
VTVRLPASSSPLLIESLETELPLFSLSLGDLANVHFKSLSLKNALLPINVQVNMHHIRQKKTSLLGCVVCIRRKGCGYIVSWCYSRPLHHLFLPFARDFARPHQRQHRTRRGFERRRRQVRTSILNIALTNYISPQGWPNKRVYNPRIHGSRQSQREFHRLPRRQPSPS